MYFLAIVSRDDQLQGKIEPSYVLRKADNKTDTRSGFFVTRENSSKYRNMPKILVKTLTGNEALISQLTHYRRKDHKPDHGTYTPEECRKYYPVGALFYFECDEYGDRTGPAVYIRNVPDKTVTSLDNGWQRYNQIISKVPSIAELLSSSEKFE